MFFIIPIGVDYRARRYPVVTFTLMGICVAVYIVTLFLKIAYGAEAINDWVFEYLWLVPAEGHWWTFLTHQFVHEGILHLVGNMVYLFLFGACCEDMIGRAHFVFFYLLAGVGAAFTHVLMSPGGFASEMPMGGASGAISGCIGGFLILFAATKINFRWIIFLWFRVWSGEFRLPAWLVISCWFLMDALKMIVTMGAHHRGGGVAFGAHVGGTVIGIGLMALEKVKLKYRPLQIDDDDDDEPVKELPPGLRKFAPQSRMRVATAPVVLETETATIHLFIGGAQTGPFTSGHIQQMFVTGGMPQDAMYWQEGMEGWRTAEELRQPGV